MLIHAIAIAVILQMNNVARAPAAHLERAQQEVIRLYHSIGVDVTWARPDAPRATLAPDIRVVLVPYEPGDMSRRERPVMGAAVLTKLGTSVAYIFYRQVEAQARQDALLPLHDPGVRDRARSWAPPVAGRSSLTRGSDARVLDARRLPPGESGSAALLERRGVADSPAGGITGAC